MGWGIELGPPGAVPLAPALLTGWLLGGAAAESCGGGWRRPAWARGKPTRPLQRDLQPLSLASHRSWRAERRLVSGWVFPSWAARSLLNAVFLVAHAAERPGMGWCDHKPLDLALARMIEGTAPRGANDELVIYERCWWRGH